MVKVHLRAAGLLLLLLAACGSVDEPRRPPPPEPLPPTPLRPDKSAPAAPTPADYGLGLDAFASSVAAAYRRDPAPVAVLPAFSDDPLHARGTQVFASGAGDWIAARVLEALRTADASLEVWAPEAAVAELSRNNRSLREVRLTQDAIPLLAHTDAGYLVYGNLERAGGRLSSAAQVRARLLCVRPSSGEVIATCDKTIESPDAVRDLAARAERTSVVLVGARAPEFTPSLDVEIALTTQRALARLLGSHRAAVAGKRCAVSVEAPASDAGRALAATVRSTLLAALPQALPGKDAITVVAAGGGAGEVVLAAMLARGTDRYALTLAARGRERDPVQVSVGIDPRFDAELRRALP